MKSTASVNRQGTILIIVAGVSALLAALALTFLTRMRSDVEESRIVLQYAQAKIMLAAACNYVQESSRLGWDRWDYTTPSNSKSALKGGQLVHDEAFGWLDVRDGEIGPKDRDGKQLFTPGSKKWPDIGGAVRCPMYRMAIPPYATALSAAYNPMDRNPSSPDYCFPVMFNPDPQPATSNKWDPNSRTSAGHPMKSGMAPLYTEHRKGDKRPVVQSAGRSWFRVYRDGPATFVLTCGAGQSEGFKDWQDVKDAGMEPYFNGDQTYFNTLRAGEIRLWYRIEWSAAVLETSYHNIHGEIAPYHEHYVAFPPNSGHTWSGNSRRTQTWVKNPVGTIRWIQRLLQEPTHY